MINKKLKHEKTNLSFTCSKIMKYLRTPKDIWSDLTEEFDFTIGQYLLSLGVILVGFIIALIFIIK